MEDREENEVAANVSWQAVGEALDQPYAKLVIWGAVAAMLVAVAWYVVGRVRGQSAQQEPSAGELLAKFRELHSRGVLSDSEFREIKTLLAARLQDEVKDTGETG